MTVQLIVIDLCRQACEFLEEQDDFVPSELKIDCYGAYPTTMFIRLDADNDRRIDHDRNKLIPVRQGKVFDLFMLLGLSAW